MLKHLERPFSAGERMDDRFEIISYLGKGGYGFTYIVHDNIQKQQVVLKTLRIHKRWSKKEQKRFLEEQTILQMLNDSSFPRFYNTGMFKNIPYFTMEYIQGQTLETLIFDHEKKWTEKQAFLFGLELLQKIRMLHTSKIVHRDLHIPNIVIKNDIIHIIDFGLSKILNSNDKVPKIYQHDFQGLGHILLFLLYTNYDVPDRKRDKSWEEELSISTFAKEIINTLFGLNRIYKNIDEIEIEIRQLLSKWEE